MDSFDAAQTFSAPAGRCVRSMRRGRGGVWHGCAAPGQASPVRRGWEHRGVALAGADVASFRPA